MIDRMGSFLKDNYKYDSTNYSFSGSSPLLGHVLKSCCIEPQILQQRTSFLPMFSGCSNECFRFLPFVFDQRGSRMFGTCDVSKDAAVGALVLGLDHAASVLLLGIVPFNGAEDVDVVFLRFGG
jgi:hypothetical protein